MRRLYLLRHAKSSWDDPELADHDRPLSRRGERAAALIAGHLREAAPSYVLCSSSLRTRQTLAAILGVLDGTVEIRVERGLYGAGASSLLDRIHTVPDDVDSVLVIAHNPGTQELAQALVGRDARLEHFPTAALATIDVPADRWSALREGRLVDYVVPRELG